MVEGGAAKADKAQFLECWQTTWKTPYIMRLALSAGIGGLLFGYDTGNSRPDLDPDVVVEIFMRKMMLFIICLQCRCDLWGYALHQRGL